MIRAASKSLAIDLSPPMNASDATYPVLCWVGSITIAATILPEALFSPTVYLTCSRIDDSSLAEVGYEAFGHPQIIPPKVRGDP